jgi:3-phenylpropionate/trans-cinnamate dioxygenase ferredoxin reductase subunit
VDGKAPEFLAFWLNHGCVVAAMNANIWDVQDDLKKLVRAGFAGQPADPDRLENPGVALSDVLR